MARKRNRKHVALLIETSNAYARNLLRGIQGYMLEHELWVTMLGEQRRGERPPAWLDAWHGDGIIARVEDEAIAELITRKNLPTVDVSAARLLSDLPWVETDDQRFANTAFEHLYERGYRKFAFCGDDRFNWSNWRCEHFVNAAKACDCESFVYAPSTPSRRGDLEDEHEDLARWIKGLPTPVGIMACYDIRGRQVLNACQGLDVSIPDQVAVIGVDNDELICNLSEPPLSSVIPNAEQAGYTAATLLDRMMAGEPIEPGRSVRIAPLGIAARRSTDGAATEDPEMIKALRFIRDHACEGITVEDCLELVSMSRRSLENRFRKLLGRSPGQEINRLKLEKACSLIQETDLPLRTVAQRCGFSHPEYFSVAFKRQYKMPPSEYSRRFRN